MSDTPRPERDLSAATRLRHAIDSGNTGDKVNYPDPAAAPLGTDDEAAGTSPSLSQADIDAEVTQPVTPQRRWIPDMLGENSVMFVLAGFALVLALLVGWLISGSVG